jgi:hypothetical protein
MQIPQIISHGPIFRRRPSHFVDPTVVDPAGNFELDLGPIYASKSVEVSADAQRDHQKSGIERAFKGSEAEVSLNTIVRRPNTVNSVFTNS